MSENKNNIELSKYAKLLDSEEWREKRELIIARDKNKCQKCANKSYLFNNKITVKLAICYINNKGVFLEFYDSQNIKRFFQKVNNLNIELENKNLYFVHGDETGNIFTVFEILKNEFKESFFQELNQTLKLIGTRPIYNEEKILKKYFSKLKIKWYYTKFLNVHHTYYQTNKKPWEYDNESLITVCRPCHEKIHQEEVIYFHDEYGKKIELIGCDRCFGTGVLPQYHYVENGVCFKCFGNRFVKMLL